MTPKQKRNLRALPWVPLRILVIGPLWLVAILGEYAETLGEWLSGRIPGLER